MERLSPEQVNTAHEERAFQRAKNMAISSNLDIYYLNPIDLPNTTVKWPALKNIITK